MVLTVSCTLIIAVFINSENFTKYVFIDMQCENDLRHLKSMENVQKINKIKGSPLVHSFCWLLHPPPQWPQICHPLSFVTHENLFVHF